MHSNNDHMRKYINIISEATQPKSLGRESPLKGISKTLYAMGRTMPEPSADAIYKAELDRKEREKAAVQKGKLTKAANAAANVGKEPTVYRFGHFRIPIADMHAYEKTKDPAIAARAIKLNVSHLHPDVANMLKNNEKWQNLLNLIMDNAIQKKNTGNSRFDSVTLERYYEKMMSNAKSEYLQHVTSRYDEKPK
jgi:hypothetical protein